MKGWGRPSRVCCFPSQWLPRAFLARSERTSIKVLCLLFGELALFLALYKYVEICHLTSFLFWFGCMCWLEKCEIRRKSWTPALPGIPDTQTDGKKSRNHNMVLLVFWCGRLKADVMPFIFVLRNTTFVHCKNPAQFSPVGNINGTTGEEQVAQVSLDVSKPFLAGRLQPKEKFS